MADDTTYRDLFRAHIEQSLRAGGDPSYMVTLAKIYDEGPEREQHLETYAFHEWVRLTPFICGECHSSFFWKTANRPEGWDLVRCDRCRERGA